MKKFLIAASALATVTGSLAATPAMAMDNGHHYGWQKQARKAQQRQAARDWRTYRNYDYNRYEQGTNRYYADRYYRDGRYYADRNLSRGDRIYRGYDGRYYCRRNDGTTGLIIGAGLGALLGNQVNVGGSRTISTILGGAAGALIGKSIDKGNVRCD
jgi:hypothetical protein